MNSIKLSNECAAQLFKKKELNQLSLSSESPFYCQINDIFCKNADSCMKLIAWKGGN